MEPAPALKLLKANKLSEKMIKQFFIIAITTYQKLTSFLPHRCRFYPSCSEYMKEAILQHGILKGIWLGVKRICRCHPLNEGGYDPVPQKTILNKN